MPTPKNAPPANKKGMVRQKFGKTGSPVVVPAKGRRHEDGSLRGAGNQGKKRK